MNDVHKVLLMQNAFCAYQYKSYNKTWLNLLIEDMASLS